MPKTFGVADGKGKPKRKDPRPKDPKRNDPKPKDPKPKDPKRNDPKTDEPPDLAPPEPVGKNIDETMLDRGIIRGQIRQIARLSGVTQKDARAVVLSMIRLGHVRVGETPGGSPLLLTGRVVRVRSRNQVGLSLRGRRVVQPNSGRIAGRAISWRGTPEG
ncbi:MAG: hypothetical protein KF727_14120 [Microbacteriaceae bacterium]|nr:hypothetical protein [Microbacteriaceae bacterium]